MYMCPQICIHVYIYIHIYIYAYYRYWYGKDLIAHDIQWRWHTLTWLVQKTVLLSREEQEMQRVSRIRKFQKVRVPDPNCFGPKTWLVQVFRSFQTCWYHCLCRAQETKKNGMRRRISRSNKSSENFWAHCWRYLAKEFRENLYVLPVSMFKVRGESTKALSHFSSHFSVVYIPIFFICI